MTGQPEPSHAELTEKLRKRLVAIGASELDVTKRFNRNGVAGHIGARDDQEIGGKASIDAVNNGQLTVAVPPAAANTLGLNDQ